MGEESISSNVSVTPSRAEFRTTEVRPFPIGEAPKSQRNPRPTGADRIVRPGVAPFEFRSGPHAQAAARVTDLVSFSDAIAVVPMDVLEYALYGGGIERWIGEAVGDADLRREIAGIRALGRHGEPLRTLLYSLSKARLAELSHI